MASIKLILDKRAARKDGTYPVKLGVSHNGYFQISLNVHVLPEHWADGMVVFPPPMQSRAKQLNEYLQGRLGYAQSTLRRLTMLGELAAMSDRELKRALDINAKPDKEKKDKALLASHFAHFIDRRKGRPNGVYHDTLKKIARYHDLGTLRFDDITIGWLKDFEGKLRDEGLAVNSIAKHFSNLRALYNDAIDYNIAGLASYPFRRFRITHEATKKRALTLAQLRELRDYPCTQSQEKYRDLFMLSFYLGGINLIDLLHIGEVVNGRIEYRRAKTSALYSIRVEPEAQAIIDRYRGVGQLLFPLDRYANHKDFLRRMNSALRSIGTFEMVDNAARDPMHVKRNKKQTTPAFPGLSTYWARHTVATLMAELDIPMETIGKVLGHADKSVTSIYVKFDQKKIDAAIRRVIDCVNG